MIDVEFHSTVDDSLLKSAVILSRYRDKWLFCQHRERDTCGYPGGRREAGGTIEYTARKELYEKTGVACLTLISLNAYSVREALEDTDTPVISYGMLYYGDITELGSMPEGYEVARITLSREPPGNWAYPDTQLVLLGYLKTQFSESGQGKGEVISDCHFQ